MRNVGTRTPGSGAYRYGSLLVRSAPQVSQRRNGCTSAAPSTSILVSGNTVDEKEINDPLVVRTTALFHITLARGRDESYIAQPLRHQL